MAVKHVYGNIGEFDQAFVYWKAYIERIEQYFVANEVTSDTKKKAIPLSMCGPSMYSTIRSLDLEYSALLELSKKHYNPKPSVIMQQYKFNLRNQRADE